MSEATTFVRMTALVSGNVQGVGYRFFAQRHASGQGLAGYVRNLPDGAVEVVAEGPRAALLRYMDALHQGPSGGEVDRVVVTWAAARGDLVGFRIRY